MTPRGGRLASPSDGALHTARASAGLVGRRVRPGGLDVSLELEAPGLPIGVLRDGRPLRLPLLAGEQVRVAVLDLPELLRLLALRLLGAGCELTVVTADPTSWAGVQKAGATNPVVVTEWLSRWPSESSQAPRALVVDMPDPPRPEFARERWTTVVHGAAEADVRAPWWISAQALLLAPGSGRTLAALRPTLDAATVAGVDRITAPTFAAVVRGGVHLAQHAPTVSETSVIGG